MIFCLRYLQGVEKLSLLYAHPDDVDFTVGGSLEAHAPGTLAGPTFLCILLEQFYRTRVSDRYFYELGGQPGSFTPGACDFSTDFQNNTRRTYIRKYTI